MLEEDLLYTLALQRVKGIGDINAKKLISIYGSAKAVFKDKRSAKIRVNGIDTVRLRKLNEKKYLPIAEKELKYISDQKIAWSYFQDEDYPGRLKHCIDAPVLFFYKGSRQWNSSPVLSIVGTRNMTGYGRAVCESFMEEIAAFKPVIVSGFAYGVDICAHRAAIKHNLITFAVLGHGFGQLYPKVHKKYYRAVLEAGGFLTDFWYNDLLLPQNFLKRNRIVAGMSDATVVIESGIKGGSLSTADIANSYNRDVFAVPGRTTDIYSQGCNALVQQNKAAIVMSGNDLIEQLQWQREERQRKSVQKRLFVELSEDEEQIYRHLEVRGKQVLESIALQCSMPVHKVTGILLLMEMKGVIRPLPGKWFEAI